MMEQATLQGSLFPSEVQFSPVFAADVNDYNGDGKADILLGGNLFNVKPKWAVMMQVMDHCLPVTGRALLTIYRQKYPDFILTVRSGILWK